MAGTSRLSDPRSTNESNLASVVGAEVNALRLEAISVLDQKNPEQYTNEYFGIEEASLGAYGSPIHVLRNIIAHLSNRHVATIIDAYTASNAAGRPTSLLVTDEHFTVRRTLKEHHSKLCVNGVISSYDQAETAEYKSIMDYAMKNIEDGHFIVSLYVDRNMRTFQEIINLLPALKESGQKTLTEGVL